MILVTGAAGFVGASVCTRLSALEDVRALARTASPKPHLPDHAHVEWAPVADLCTVTDWAALLDGVTTVIHLAARTHVLHETEADPLSAYRRINVTATEHLANACVKAGVKRLVFLSSIKVNGESTTNQPFRETDTPQPQDAYGISKWEAEHALFRISRETGLEVTVIRPPLVYGPGVKGNFLRLLGIARRGWPLPLASVHNLRSFVYVENLADAIAVCATHPAAAGKTYLVSDGADLSTPHLIRELASRQGARAPMLPCPTWLLQGAASMMGRGAEAARLLGSLQVDSAPIRADLHWVPPHSVAQGLDQTTRWYSGQNPVKSNT